MPFTCRRPWLPAIAGASAAILLAGVIVTTRTDAAHLPAAATTAAGPSVAPAVPSAPAGAGATGTADRVSRTPARPSREQAIEQARATVARNGRAILAAKGETYQPRSVVVDPDGARHVRFDRTHRGLEVLGGDYVVHTAPDGSLRDTTLAQSQVISVGTRPAVDARRAVAAALRGNPGARGRGAARLIVDAREGTPVLAWQVPVEDAGAGGTRIARTAVVDASTGVVRARFDDVHTARGTGHGHHVGEVELDTTERPDGSFVLIDPTRGGNEIRDGLDARTPKPATSELFTDADNAWGNGDPGDRATAAVDVHYGMARTWDYFARAHGRRGVADDGKGLLAIVHMDDANAGWYSSCPCIKFGDGDEARRPFTPLDIVAHEVAHAVTDATADLIYGGESGGLNEATSDIFGTLVEFAAGNAVDPPDYLIGERLDAGGGPPLRYMDDPTRDGVSEGCWTPETGDEEVHQSSGVANKFFYMLAVGSAKSSWGESPTCGGAPAVTGIGNDKAGRIWYRALTTYMVSDTDFHEAREATLFATADLFGGRSAEFTTVDAAWRAVGVTGPDPLPEAPSVQRPADQEGEVGDRVRLQIDARDAHGDALSYAATKLPAGLAISDSGLISGTLTGESSALVRVTVTDVHGHAADVQFSWDVSGPPVVREPGDQVHPLGARVALDIEARDLNHPLTYTAADLPDGLYLETYSAAIGGRPAKLGTWRSSITVTDATQRSTTVSFTWTIRPGEGPAAPTSLTVTRINSFLSAIWQPPADSDSEEITGYEITLTPGETVTVDRFSTSQFWSDLDPDTAYTLSVRAVNANGPGAAATIEIPADPV